MAKPSKPATVAEILSSPSSDVEALPPRVAALRAKVLEACAGGDIEALRVPLEWSETPPSLTRDSAARPRGFAPMIDFLKARSFDGKGAETLAIAQAVFSAPFVVVRRGVFTTYVWPAWARLAPEALRGLSDEQRVAMWACVRFADLRAPSRDGRPLMQHAGVGPDGTWHYFWSVEPA